MTKQSFQCLVDEALKKASIDKDKIKDYDRIVDDAFYLYQKQEKQNDQTAQKCVHSALACIEMLT